MIVPNGASNLNLEITLETNAQKKTLFAKMRQTGFELCLTNAPGLMGVISGPDVGTWGAPRGSKYKMQHTCQDF